MVQRYKELFYGLLFGLGASAIDVSMHASMEQHGFWAELFRPQPFTPARRNPRASTPSPSTTIVGGLTADTRES